MMFRMFDQIQLTIHRDERSLLKVHEFFFPCDGLRWRARFGRPLTDVPGNRRSFQAFSVP
jgi:hypothetical protein